MNVKRELLDKTKKETYKVNTKGLNKSPQDIEKELVVMQEYKHSDIKQVYTHVRKGV